MRKPLTVTRLSGVNDGVDHDEASELFVNVSASLDRVRKEVTLVLAVLGVLGLPSVE